MFHWWNGGTVETAADANWIREGFTEYYASKTLVSTVVISEAQAQEILGARWKKLFSSTGPVPINFVKASVRLLKGKDSSQYDAVYHGGAIIAAHLDKRLQDQGKSLDQVWSAALRLGRPVRTTDFVSMINKLGGEALGKELDLMLYGRSVLPRPGAGTSWAREKQLLAGELKR